jgi:hypothetical protein
VIETSILIPTKNGAEDIGGHDGPPYERLKKNGDIVLQLHSWNAYEHPNLGDPDAAAQRGSTG